MSKYDLADFRALIWAIEELSMLIVRVGSGVGVPDAVGSTV